MKRLWALVLHHLQMRCKHPSENVVADILEGDASPEAVKWCRLCGAYWRVWPSLGREQGEWRVPRPDWES